MKKLCWKSSWLLNSKQRGLLAVRIAWKQMRGRTFSTGSSIKEWKQAGEPRTKKSRKSKSNVKTMLIVFFDFRLIVHQEFVRPDPTVNRHVYVDGLRRLRARVDQVRPDLGCGSHQCSSQKNLIWDSPRYSFWTWITQLHNFFHIPWINHTSPHQPHSCKINFQHEKTANQIELSQRKGEWSRFPLPRSHSISLRKGGWKRGNKKTDDD